MTDQNDQNTPEVPSAPPTPSAAPTPPAPSYSAPPTPSAPDYSTPAAPTAYPPAQPYGEQPSYGAQPSYAAQDKSAYGQQPGQYAYAPAGPVQPTGLALASMITGLGALIVGPLASVAAIILGHMAKKQQPWARGMWLTGLVSGYVILGLWVVGIILYVVFLVFIFGAAGMSTWDSGTSYNS